MTGAGIELAERALIAERKRDPQQPSANADPYPLLGQEAADTVNKMLGNNPHWGWKRTQTWLRQRGVAIYDRAGWQKAFGSEPPKKKGAIALVNQSDLLRVIREQLAVHDAAYEAMDDLAERDPQPSRRTKTPPRK